MFSNISNSIQSMFSSFIEAIPSIIAALFLLLLAWIVAKIAKGIVEKLFVKLGADKGLAKSRLVKDEEAGRKFLESAAKVVYLLVFILFLPAILDALNMNSVSGPISNMMDKLLGFIPNILAAGIILLIGYFIAKIVKDLVERLLRGLHLDKWINKVKPDSNQSTQEQVSISAVLANTVFVLILIPVLTMALETLEINSISDPITSVLNQVFAMIPNIFIAIILIIAGYYIAKIVGDLLTSLLQGTGINNIFSFLNLENTSRAIPFDLAKVLGTVVKVLIVLFFAVEALSLLHLDVLNNIGSAVILYLPLLVSALLILGGGLFLGHFLENLIKKYTNSILSANIVKYTVIVFAVFMALDQLQFATSIVNIAFILILGGLMIAFAISFGIGGRDFARQQLAKLEAKMNRKDNNL